MLTSPSPSPALYTQVSNPIWGSPFGDSWLSLKPHLGHPPTHLRARINIKFQISIHGLVPIYCQSGPLSENTATDKLSYPTVRTSLQADWDLHYNYHPIFDHSLNSNQCNRTTKRKSWGIWAVRVSRNPKGKLKSYLIGVEEPYWLLVLPQFISNISYRSLLSSASSV